MPGHIRFEDVTFGYDRHQPILKDFDLEIRAGEMVGVVGRSGSGKTTLANLIGRFYDVDAGRVTIDGRDVRKLAREDLRCQVGVVLQEPFLFRGTVWENLVYGRPSASREEALTAAKAANAHDFVLRLPLGYDTPLANGARACRAARNSGCRLPGLCSTTRASSSSTKRPAAWTPSRKRRSRTPWPS